MRRAAKIDNNQNKIVSMLRQIPGVSVDLNHNDILAGYKGKTFWYEIKDPKRAVSKKTGLVLASALKESQKRLLDTWKGHYKVVSSIEEILTDIGINGR